MPSTEVSGDTAAAIIRNEAQTTERVPAPPSIQRLGRRILESAAPQCLACFEAQFDANAEAAKIGPRGKSYDEAERDFALGHNCVGYDDAIGHCSKFILPEPLTVSYNAVDDQQTKTPGNPSIE